MSESKQQTYDISSDDEFYADASSVIDNEKIVDDLFKKHLDINENTTENNTNISKTIHGENDNDNNDEGHEEKFTDCEDEIDEESQRDYEKNLTDEEIETNKLKSNELKNEGNIAFKNEEYEKSLELYTSGLKLCPISCENERAILYANRAAAKIKLGATQTAIDDCDKALKFNPLYLKALLRRAKLYEETDKLDESLVDYKKILEIETGNIEAKQALIRLPPKIDERNEKLKTEMMGKLKDLGNLILKPFGLSTNNFQMQQDPLTGSYSINYKN